MSSNIMKPIFPPIGGGTGETIGKIIKVVKTLFGLFKKPSQEAGETDSNDSLENVERITQIFVDFKEQVHSRAVKLENAVDGEVNYYVEELHNILSENREKVVKYGIHTKRLKRQIDKISSRVKGIIDNELSKKVSLDNIECRKIVKMVPGSKKESAMAAFLSESVKEALDTCCSELHSSFDEIYDDAETEVVEAVEFIQKQTEDLKERFASIDEVNYEKTAKKQMVEAYYLIDICDLICDLF